MHLKRIIFILIFSATLISAGCKSTPDSGENEIPADVVNNPNSANGSTQTGNLPAITFEEVEHDFGRILEGESVSYSFKFTNTGKTDLIIAEVSTSCGCTVPTYSKTPIRPGEAGLVKVAFNSQGKRGFQTKNVLVVANTQPNTTILKIKAQVVTAGSEK